MQTLPKINSVTIIGAGNVGWHLAMAFHKEGIEIQYIISRTLKKAEKLAVKVNAKAADTLSNIEISADMLLICISDDGIEDLIPQLNTIKSIIVHTSGSVGIEVFSPLSNQYGVFYPLQSFTGSKKMNYTDIPFLIEASSIETEEVLVQLVKRISGRAVHVNSASRKKIHMAAVFACNFSNHMVGIAQGLLNEEGLDNALLNPLIRETMIKLESLSSLEAQTGPAAREDYQIMEEHLNALQDHPFEKEIYRLISENIIRYKKQ